MRLVIRYSNVIRLGARVVSRIDDDTVSDLQADFAEQPLYFCGGGKSRIVHEQ